MGNGYIYLYRDSGYELGVKIGYDGSPRCRSTWNAAPSYSPRPMLFVAAWKIPDRFFLSSQTPKKSREGVERMLHSACGPMMAEMPEFPRTGRDWCWTTADHALETITSQLGAKPDLLDPYKGLVVSNDNLRNPHPTKVASHPIKIVLWTYRELHTGLLKTQYIDDWRSPRERARRYSRNGIEEIAAHTYDGPTISAENLKVLELWSHAVERFGFGTEDKYYGWLRPECHLEELLSFYDAHLRRAEHRSAVPPEGVRRAYNEARISPP